jgi:hypothetical protein
MTASPPTLSVIVTLVDGGSALVACIDALLQQVGGPAMEIIVPYDDSVADVGQLSERFPSVRFLDLGSLRAGDDRPLNDFTRHRLYDIRRARGLQAATGRLLAIVEDRGRPRADWAKAMTDVHAQSSYAAVGGVVEHGGDGPLRWAVFFCDFGRFQPPVYEDSPEYITDTNICYSREALEGVSGLWSERYQEPTVNWALRRQGLQLHLSERPVTMQKRDAITFGSVLRERVHWARLFGHIRGREASSSKTLAWAVTTPLLPFVLFGRHLRRELKRRRNLREFVVAGPLMMPLLCAWALGECIGYLEAAGSRRRRLRKTR